MFNSIKNTTMGKSNNAESSVNLMGAGTVIEGDIKSDGDIRVDGKLIGSLITKGKLVIGSTGNIEGEVVCQNADISGSINGKLSVQELLSLKSTSKINGDIITNKLAIEPGANFSGSCSMGGIIKDLNNADRTRQEEKVASY